jgi:hypothetical protein
MSYILDKYQKLILLISVPFPWLYNFVNESKWYSPFKFFLVTYYLWMYIIGVIFYVIIPMWLLFFIGYLILSTTDWIGLTEYFNGSAI